MRSEDYLREIRGSAGLKRAVLKKITVTGKKVIFSLVTDLTYTEEDVAHARSVSGKYAPAGYEGTAEVVKSVPDPAGVRAEIAGLLKRKFPAAAAFISPEDIEAVTDRTGGRFYITAGESERAQFASGDVLNAVAEQLCRSFCGGWTGEYRTAAHREREIEHEALPPMEILGAPRMFDVTDYIAVDGAQPRKALCIADLKGEMQGITLCGTVTRIEERMTKNEKPFFRIAVSDPTGQITVSYFSKKATLEKVRSIKQGDGVCLTGNYELYNGSLSFTARSVDFGLPPKDFVPQARVSRPVPAKYAAVTPEPVSDFVQADMFGGIPLPADLVSGRYVVFDLETTGLNYTPVGGVMDHIIEVGAVKIEGGQIVEKFSTFVACPQRLSGEIIKLTGIDDGMLAGAPDVKDVIADFFKFCEGSTLVAHNVSFDSGFVRYYGEQEGYLFEHPLLDTVELAREILPQLNNYKLNTIADHYGFTFNHHRAFDDAFVTAKIFLELARARGKLS